MHDRKGVACVDDSASEASRSDVMTMSVPALQRLIEENGLEWGDCVEKHELQARAAQALEKEEERDGVDGVDDSASEDGRPESQITDDGDKEPSDGISLGSQDDEDDEDDEEDEDDEDEEDEDDSSSFIAGDDEDIEYESELDEIGRCDAILRRKRKRE